MSRADDETYMRRALAAARLMLGRTWPNPAVGCVIVKDGQVLAETATAPGGRPHAEEQALALAGEAARGATVYITLEPCGQRSTGECSCAHRLADAGVGRVVVAADNPEPLSAGRGLTHLIAAHVPTELGFLAQEAEPLYRGFRHRLSTGRPLLELSSTGDGFDGAFALGPGETPDAALARLGRAGYGRMWITDGSDLALRLKNMGFLG